MKTPDRGQERLVQALRNAYRSKESLEVDKVWHDNLMTRIRRTGPVQAPPRFLPSFGQFAWKLAPVTCPLAALLILIALAIRLYPGSGYDTLQLLVNSIQELSFPSIFAT